MAGSPPPTRGTHKELTDYAVLDGITPAYAGNTIITAPCPLASGDHPRLRGEHTPSINDNYAIVGSPPPTRGTLKYAPCKYAFIGITPAYAGNTC